MVKLFSKIPIHSYSLIFYSPCDPLFRYLPNKLSINIFRLRAYQRITYLYTVQYLRLSRDIFIALFIANWNMATEIGVMKDLSAFCILTGFINHLAILTKIFLTKVFIVCNVNK